jgi:hypothetical protein
MQKGGPPARYQILLAGILITSLLCAQTPAPADKVEMLNRPAGIKTFTATSGAAVADLLDGTHVPGGIISVYSRCATPTEYQFSFSGATLEKELDYIASIDTSRKWIFREGAILVGSDMLPRTILNAIIKEIDLKPDDALSLTTQRLLESQEVRDRAKVAGLEEGMTPVSGFYALPNPSTPNEHLAPAAPRHLHQVTVAEALDQLAMMKGQKVWHYEQFECGNRPSYRITWVVR